MALKQWTATDLSLDDDCSFDLPLSAQTMNREVGITV